MKYCLKVSDKHMVYKYDLSIHFFRWMILLMWKPTHTGSPIRTKYLSFRLYNKRTWKVLIHKQF